MTKISVIVPALNEEKNIISAIENINSTFKKLGIEGEIIVVDDGSSDKTFMLVKEKQKEFNNLKVIKNEKNMGVGFSFWKGVENAEGEAVVMIPGDNENDAYEILRYHQLLDSVDIVINFIFNKEIRPFLRRFLSFCFNVIINFTFLTHFHYTNGTILVRRSVLQSITHKSRGFFFQAEFLIKLTKRGYLFAEVPSKLNKRRAGKSSAIKLSSLIQTIKDYLKLVFDIYVLERTKRNLIIEDSITYQRKKNYYD